MQIDTLEFKGVNLYLSMDNVQQTHIYFLSLLHSRDIYVIVPQWLLNVVFLMDIYNG